MITEFAIIWEKLHSNNVKYLIIGGLAVNIYGYTRNTGDIDILIEDSLENRKNLRQAFLEIGIGDIPAIETMLFLPGWTDFSLFFGLRLDVMTTIKGLENVPFQDLLDNATKVMMGNVAINFIDYDNLIKTKKATNRLKDQLDLEELYKMNNPNND
jgi:predicted nucleotidyltransferase